ncbi:GNAT family N-acetyltransferase [Sediminibacillus halophilus]|uniref:Acetyltransferase (GNAT) domain-containing protein n=1 Tax=Sediminibacillus halophilus TaxID=482461 RepID=A0A1G9NP98_9BACI|nr:GNAT family N-acetyltransferase [Sediminibacillus halophilus]SDL87825.1 Acetyltransferase (GNAT) domain-containing protein [Sediminibacillus halophilus]
MEIRKPDEFEQELILKLSPQAVREGTAGESAPDANKTKKLIESVLQKGGCYWAAFEHDQLLGWSLIGKGKDSFTDKPFGFVYELFVVPAYRGKGIAEQLLHAVCDQLKSAGHQEVRLSVHAENSAIELYKKLGFTEKTFTMKREL